MKTIQIVFFSGHHRDFDRDQETHRHRDSDTETHHHRDRECDRWSRNDHYRHHEIHRHRDYHDHRDHGTDRHCRNYYDSRERETLRHGDYHDYRDERERGTHHQRDGRVTKVLQVPTRPRSKRRYECRMKRGSLRSYVKNLGLTPAELQEKVRKMREARDYSFLLSEECDNSVKGVQENNDVRLYSALTKFLNQNNPQQFGAATSKLSKVGRVESVEKKHGGSLTSLLVFVPDDVDDDDDVPSSRKKGSKRRREGGETAAKKRRTCKIDGGDDEQ